VWEQPILDGTEEKLLAGMSDGKVYLVKFGKASKIYTHPWIHNYITEYIGSGIARNLGYKAQYADLGIYNGRKCVLIEHLGYTIISIGEEGESTVSESKKEIYNLSYMLKYSEVNKKFGVEEEDYKRWAVRLFLLDIFLDNRDRHEGNWGFYRDEKGLYQIASLFDFGACLSTRFVCNEELLVLANTDTAIRDAVNNGIKLATPINGKKRIGLEILKSIHKQKEFRSILEDEVAQFNTKIKRLDIEPLLQSVEAFGSEYNSYTDYVRNLIHYKTQKGIVL
jgi:hypothetical protein